MPWSDIPPSEGLLKVSPPRSHALLTHGGPELRYGVARCDALALSVVLELPEWPLLCSISCFCISLK